MFNLFKKKQVNSNSIPHESDGHDFKWYEVGEGNPFNKRVLDIRDFTNNMLSMTSNPQIAELFLQRRNSIGKELIDAKFEGGTEIITSLEYPHDGSIMEGAGPRAKEMEDKWDIYCWNNIMYFARSWTGEVVYKAHINVSETKFSIYKIEYVESKYTLSDTTLVIDDVHFIVISYLFGKIFPHRIPRSLVNDSEIALYSFSQFGRNCWYATHESIIDAVAK